jgi:hypothetical protein
MSNGLVKTSSGPQKKGRTITFRVDDEVAEKLEKYAKMRNTSLSRVLRNWCESSDLRVELPTRVRKKLELMVLEDAILVEIIEILNHRIEIKRCVNDWCERIFRVPGKGGYQKVYCGRSCQVKAYQERRN